MADKASLVVEHNHACERATYSDCSCYCNGAGHQHDLIVRAASCKDQGSSNVQQLKSDLADVYGGFHQSERDVATPTRRKAKMPDPKDVRSLNLDRGRGATWVETLLLDEALHAAFILVADESRQLKKEQRKARADFVDGLTLGAIATVGGDLDVHNVVESHIWCSIIAAFLDSADPARITRYGVICYPRERRSRVPSRLRALSAGGLALAQSSFGGTFHGMSVGHKRQLLRLIGAATCPDLWHHPAAVRFCLQPFVEDISWPPSATTALAIMPRFGKLELRWTKRGNW